MTTLTLKEQRAIEYRYMNIPHKKIADKLGVPKQTVDEWFKPSRGRLSPYFQVYAKDMTAFRQKQMQKLMEDSDRQILIVIRLYLIRMQELLLYGKKKVLMQNGEPVLDKNGNVRYYYEPFAPRFLDFYRAWKMQRVMKGLPTDIKETRCRDCGKIKHRML